MAKLRHAILRHVVTSVVWLAVVLSGWYWMTPGAKSQVPARFDAVPSALKPDPSDTVGLARILGAASPVDSGPGPGLSQRFVMSGVIAGSLGQGAALISVDGKPARAFAVGAELALGYVLAAVAPREAMLAERVLGPVVAVLSMPLQRLAEVAVAPSTMGSGATRASADSAVPVPPAFGASAISSLSASVANDQVPTAPARADARRQPQTSLRRDDRRTP